MFVFIGAAPYTDWLGDRVARDDRGFVLAGPDVRRQRHLAARARPVPARDVAARRVRRRRRAPPLDQARGQRRRRGLDEPCSSSTSTWPTHDRDARGAAGDRPVRRTCRRSSCGRGSTRSRSSASRPATRCCASGRGAEAFTLLLEGRLDGYLHRDGREEHDHYHQAPTWLGAMGTLTGDESIVTIRATRAQPDRRRGADGFSALLFATPVAFQRVMRTFRPVLSRFSAMESQREKLAALGQMSAGLAHELNNPAAAAKRSAQALGERAGLDQLGDGDLRRRPGWSAGRRRTLVRLQQDALARACAATPQDAIGARRRRGRDGRAAGGARHRRRVADRGAARRRGARPRVARPGRATTRARRSPRPWTGWRRR